MNWFQQNRFLGSFLAALTLGTPLCVYFLIHEKGAADEGRDRLEATINELTRLRRSSPFPNEENLQKTKTQTDSCRASLLALENELKTRMFPNPSLQPNEFQAQLRQATLALSDRARASKVQLPKNFNLGFDEYATSLPNGLVAPRLGRQLKAIEWLANTIVDAHVDALNSLARGTLPEEKSAPTPTPEAAKTRGRKPQAAEESARIVDSTPVDLAFTGSPAAARRLFNQITSAKEQFYIIRTLQVKNQADKGPKRGGPPEAPPSAAAVPQSSPSGAGRTPEQGITFIVGTEHLIVTAKIEIVKFNFPEKEAR